MNIKIYYKINFISIWEKKDRYETNRTTSDVELRGKTSN